MLCPIWLKIHVYTNVSLWVFFPSQFSSSDFFYNTSFKLMDGNFPFLRANTDISVPYIQNLGCISSPVQKFWILYTTEPVPD